MATKRTIRRLVWRHNNSGSIPIMGEGNASNTIALTGEDADWLNRQFGPTLYFVLQEWDWDDDDWVEVNDGD